MIQRLLNRYIDMTSLVITYHPIADIATVEKSMSRDVLRDFLTYCLVKKSPSSAIEMVASGGILHMFSNPNPNLSITMKKRIKASVRTQ